MSVASVTLTIEELQAVRDEAAAEAREGYVDEMVEIRRQYEARLREAERRVERAHERREELEFQVRLALTRLRDLEAGSRAHAVEADRVRQSLASLLVEIDGAAPLPPPPAPPVRPKLVAAPPPRPTTAPKKTLPVDYKKHVIG
jgi:hypothetical protein